MKNIIITVEIWDGASKTDGLSRNFSIEKRDFEGVVEDMLDTIEKSNEPMK